MSPFTAAVFRALARAARIWSLLAGVLLYALGGGIVHYLGYIIDWPVYWLGQGAVTLLQLSMFMLREYFDRATQPPFEPLRPPVRRRAPPSNLAPAGETDPDALQPEGEVEAILVPRIIFLQVAAASLTIGAVVTVLLYAGHKLNPPAFVFMGIAFLLGLAYAVPPLRLVYSGYGELILSILVANLFPALAFMLQVGSLHRLLAMLTFPLTLLYLAAELARSLRHYFVDSRENRHTMLVRLGWQRGMTLHNALIAFAYVALAVSLVSGLPWRLTYPGLLSLPVAVFQIWQMNSIAGGAKPRWNLLGYTAMATIGLAAYFINLALWIG